MTVRDIFQKAMIMLGYTGSNGEISGEQEYLKRGIVAVNQVYADLFYALGNSSFVPAEKSMDKIDLPERVLYDVMPYGVAMFIAQSENDGDSQQLFAETYTRKRASLRHENSIKDVIPRSCD